MTNKGHQGEPTPTRLDSICHKTRERFEAKQRILSYPEYFELFLSHPEQHARGSAQYVRDCFTHFGYDEKPEPWGVAKHYHLFDRPHDGGKGRLIGQERAQEAMFRALTNFVQEGRVQRLVLLHGPNGSAKSSLIAAMMAALEAYSHTDEGALYCFNWIFPTEKISRSTIGFGGGDGATTRLDTFAYLDELEIDAKIVSDLRDHPLFLIDSDQRSTLLDEVLAKDDEDSSFVLSDYVRLGELSHMSNQIYEALLTAYKGDHAAVLKHVQVERFFISRRYRMGAITIEPQLRVDAGSRQVTVDRSLQSLPASLQNQTLFEPFGDLVDGNRGLVEFNDLLKRQPEFYKYLLSTSEKGTVALENSILFLDAVLVGSANETYLEAFKNSPDFPSFKARLDLIRMPYLLSHHTEQRIYDEQISSTEIGKPILPHTTAVAALWAVLTRLTRPDKDLYPESIRDHVAKLTPLQKAQLYASGTVPDGLASEEARELKAAVKEMMKEGEGSNDYEGRYGASPREMKMIVLNAAQNPHYPHLSPLAVFEELRRLVMDPSVYPFLQMEPDGEYRAHDKFIDVVIDHYLDTIDREVRSAMGLVDELQYKNLFARYVTHVTHWIRGEKVYTKATGKHEDADETFMQEVEEMLGSAHGPDEHRNTLMSAIAAWSIDHPGEPIVYDAIFPEHVDALKRSYYDEHITLVRRIKENLLHYLDDKDSSALSKADREQAETALSNLKTNFGYSDAGAREVVTFLLKKRYEP